MSSVSQKLLTIRQKKLTSLLYVWGDNSDSQIGNKGVPNQASLFPVNVSGNNSWTSVSAGDSHTLAIRSDGALFAWGANGSGRLGDGTTVNKSNPVQIAPTYSWTSVSAGGSHTLAIRSDGALFAWGYNNSGRLGDGTIINKSSPVKVGASSWTSVSAGSSHTLAIRKDSALFAWGSNTSGRLGDGTLNNKSSPVQIASSSSWTAVSAGLSHTVAIRSDGALFACGAGIATGRYSSIVTPIKLNNTYWKSLSISQHAAGVTTNGKLFTWGRNLEGQLGDNTNVDKITPTEVPFASPGFSKIKISAAIRNDGALFSWGSNSDGQLGDGTVIYRSSPVQIGTSSWTSVDAGDRHTLAIRSDGRLFAWGHNTTGHLGLGDTVYRSSPVQVGTSSWTSVSSGYKSTTAIRSDGKLFTWGRNSFGQLGDGTVIYRSSPVQIGTPSSWTSVSAGLSHTTAIRSDGALFAWGANDDGRIGDGTLIYRSSPVQIGTSSWTSVSGGFRHTAAIRSDGALFAWGSNSFGRLGDGTTINKSSPVKVGASSWTSVSAGVYHTAAIRKDSALFTWGSNGSGQLGDGTKINKSSPVQVASPSSWTSVDAGPSHTAAIRSDGALFSWGYNKSGRLGDGTVIYRSSPVQIGIGLTGWNQANVGLKHTTAITTDGKLFTWGYNGNGQLGDNNTPYNKSSPVQLGTSSWTSAGAYTAIRKDGALFTWGANNYGQLGSNISDLILPSRSSPVQVGASSWTAVSEGTFHRAAIRKDGALFTWGNNGSGRLGSNNDELTLPSRSSPVQIASPSSWTSVSAGDTNTLAIRSDNVLFTWGNNALGQLGLGDVVYRSSPTVVYSNIFGNKVIASSSSRTTFSIRSDGALFAWGLNSFGQLGDGTIVSKSYPVQIGTSSWTSVSAGSLHTTAIRSDGALFAWGDNNRGQLGDGTVIYRSSPVQIGTPSSWTSVSAGLSHTTAIRSDGALFAWGANDFGQFGDGTTVSKSTPVQIASPSSWTAVSAGQSHTLAIRSDGKLFAWGANDFGQLGDGTTINKSSPVTVGTGTSSWTSVSAGTVHTAAIRSDGKLFAWGCNDDGRLGDGTKTYRSSPVTVGTGTSSWTAVSAGGSHTLAIRKDGKLFAWGGGAFGPTTSPRGAIGDGFDVPRSSPVTVGAGTSSWTAVSAGIYDSTAIRLDGKLFTWGYNDIGQLGDGTIINKSSPVQISSFLPSLSTIKSGYNHTLLTNSNGKLFAWGFNGKGQLGDGTRIARLAPVQIGVSSWSSVFAGGNNSGAINT